MTPTCPRCQLAASPDDLYCSSCGHRLAPDISDITPVPGVIEPVDLRVRKSRKTRRPWYRRKLVVIPMMLLILIGAGTAGTLAYLTAQFSSVNAISTPPPEIASDVLGGNQGRSIDTGPAQQALRAAESGRPMTRDIAMAPGGSTVWLAQSASGTPPGESATPAAPAQQAEVRSDDGSVTILLMGVDARPGEAIDINVRPDTLAVLQLDGDTGSCRLLSVPRDTRTELPGYGLTKINHALAVGGIPYQILVTQQLLGIEFDHYGLIDFAGIEGLVDAVGGVTVVNDRVFTAGGFTFEAGEITLNGEEALAYARFRQDERGDFGRQERQQQIVRSLIGQTSGMDVVTGANRLLGAVEGHVKTDLSPTELIGLANEYRSTCTADTLEGEQLDGTTATFFDPLLEMDLSYVLVEDAEIERKVAWLMSDE